MKKTNFDTYLDEQLKDMAFAKRFEQAGEAWEKRCEWGHDDYSLQVENLPKAPPKPGQQELEL